MANPEEDPYDAEAIRRRVGQQFGIPAQTQQQGGDETTAPAPTDHSVIIQNLRKAAEERTIENAKSKQSELGLPEAVAGASALAGQQIGQRIAVPPSDYFNAKSLHGDLEKKLSAAQQAAADALQHANDWKEHHDWLHSEHAVNEHLPEEFQTSAKETEPIVKRAPESPAGGKNYGPKFGATPAQSLEAASMQDVQRNIVPKNQRAVETIKSIAPEYNLYDTGEGNLLELTPQQAAEREAQKQRAIEARSQAEKSLEPHRQNAKEQLKVAADKANQATLRAEELAADKAAARAAQVSAESKMSPVLRATSETIGEGSKYLPSWANKALTTVTPYAAKASKALGPLGAVLAPSQISEGYGELKQGQIGRGLAHMAGGAGGLLALAPLAAGVGLLAPELAIGAAGAGALASLPSLGYDVSDIYNKYFTGKK
jgi:hypothetical protein